MRIFTLKLKTYPFPKALAYALAGAVWRAWKWMSCCPQDCDLVWQKCAIESWVSIWSEDAGWNPKFLCREIAAGSAGSSPVVLVLNQRPKMWWGKFQDMPSITCHCYMSPYAILTFTELLEPLRVLVCVCFWHSLNMHAQITKIVEQFSWDSC